MNSFRWRMAVWYALGLLLVVGVCTGMTYLHLQHELRVERWERELPGHADWTLHGSFSQAEVDDIAGEYGQLALLLAIPVAFLSLGWGYFLATRTLRPLADLNRQLQEIGARQLDDRVHLDRADREFRSIEANINDLLGRLQNAFQQLNEYSAQVAHELRAPLTLLRLQVEAGAERMDPALAESLQEELRRLSEFVDQSLLLATAEQGRLVSVRESVPLRSVVADLLEAYTLWARSEGRSIVFDDGPDPVIAADPRHLRQLLHVLLSNAIRHGAGPLRIRLTAEPRGVRCRIENELPSRAGTAPASGCGIGLRLARALAPTLGCVLNTRASGSLFSAEVEWPAPDTAPVPGAARERAGSPGH